MPSIKRWVYLSFGMFALLAVYLFSKMSAGFIDLAGFEDPIGGAVPLSTIIGIVAGVVTYIVFMKHPRAEEFGMEVVKEIKKVTWPTVLETRAATIVVIILVLIISAILGFFDFAFSSATNWIYR